MVCSHLRCRSCSRTLAGAATGGADARAVAGAGLRRAAAVGAARVEQAHFLSGRQQVGAAVTTMSPAFKPLVTATPSAVLSPSLTSTARTVSHWRDPPPTRGVGVAGVRAMFGTTIVCGGGEIQAHRGAHADLSVIRIGDAEPRAV